FHQFFLALRALPSFPTRRSSDLDVLVELKPNLHLLPSNSDLDYLDQDVWSNQKAYPFPFTLLKNALTSKYEASRTHIIFDASPRDRKSTRLNSSHVSISYAVFCL